MTNIADLCDRVIDQCDPANGDTQVYVGLEHIDSGTFFLSRHGSPREVRSTKMRFRRGDLLYGKLRPYLDKAVIAPVDGICSTDILPLRPRSGVSSKYLLALLHTPQFAEHAVQATHGVNHPRISWPAIASFVWRAPAISEQERIGIILWNVQLAMDTQTRLISATREVKHAVARELFTRGVADASGEDSFPTGWRLARFEELATLQRGFDLPTKDRSTGSVPVIGSNGIVGYHDTSKLVGPGVVIGRSGTIGRSHYVEEPYWPLNTGLFVSDFHGHNPLYVHYFFEFFDLRRYATGVSVPTLNRNLVHETPIRIPLREEQDSIASTIASIDRAIEARARKHALLGELFNTLLHDLMTGRLRTDEISTS